VNNPLDKKVNNFSGQFLQAAVNIVSNILETAAVKAAKKLA